MPVYSKIFVSMYDGSLATQGPWQALVAFQQMLILANRHGVVDMTPEAMSRRTTVPLEIFEAGIPVLEAPDTSSRSGIEEGRRIKRLHPDREWGWQIVNFEAYNAIRTEEDRRDYMRNYMREWRKEGKSVKSVKKVNTVSLLDSDNTQTRKESRGRATALPPDFDLTDDQVAYAKSKGVQDVNRELEAFKAHHQAHGKTMKSWPAAWRTWCLNFQKFGGRSSGEKPRKLSAVERVVQATRKRDAEIDAAAGQDGQRALEEDGGDLRSPLDEPVWRD